MLWAMPKPVLRILVAGLTVCLLAACGGRTKEDIVSKARDVSTRAQLEQALGQPDDIAKLGPMERWTYVASNGQVVFVVIGDTVTLQTTGPARPKE